MFSVLLRRVPRTRQFNLSIARFSCNPLVISLPRHFLSSSIKSISPSVCRSFSSRPQTKENNSSDSHSDESSESGEVTGNSLLSSTVVGLSSSRVGDLVEFSRSGSAVGLGLVLTLNNNSVTVGNLSGAIEAGDQVRNKGKISFPVGDTGFGGRVFNALGEPITIPLSSSSSSSSSTSSPAVSDTFTDFRPSLFASNVAFARLDNSREFIASGIKSVDFIRPIAKGSRTALVGPKFTGKSHLAIDLLSFAVANGSADHGIYVAIAKSRMELNSIVEKFKKHGIFNKITIIYAADSDSPMKIYLSPFAGCTLADYYRDSGKSAMIVYDDLANHGNCCWTINQELGLPLLGHNETQARLLERSARLIDGGSSTAICLLDSGDEGKTPKVMESIAGIVDQTIQFDSDMAAQRIWPAINCGSIINRPASRYRSSLTRSLLGEIVSQFSQSEKLFSQYRWAAEFGLEPESDEEEILLYREKMQILMEQKKSTSLEHQYLIFQAAAINFLAAISLKSIRMFEEKLIAHMQETQTELMAELKLACENQETIIKPTLANKIKEEIEEFCDQWRRIHGADD